MKKALQFIQTHWLSLLSGAVALAAIVFCVLGMSSDKVNQQMKKKLDEIGAAGIGAMISKPHNEATIAAEKQRGRLFEEEYKKTVAEAKRINAREVLMPGVFPVPEKAVTPFEFRQEYAKAVAGLYKPMNGGTLPTEAEIQEEAQNIADLVLLEEEKRAESAGEPDDRTPSAVTGTRTPAPIVGGRTPAPIGGRTPAPIGGRTPGPIAGGRTMGPAGGRTPAGPSGTGAGALISMSGEPKYNPEYRARVSKAKNILCYYDPTTFHVSPIALEQTTSPPPEQMWFAQVGLWIQEDVVQAIAELNREAANQAQVSEACVQDAVVKHLVNVRVRGYVVSPSEQSAGGEILFPATVEGSAAGLIGGGPSLTKRVSDSQFDVVRFVVTVILDQRNILKFINQMSKVNFYQCVNMRYEKVDVDDAQNAGYFYGTNPVVRATFEFEGYMSREVYQPLMPKDVRKLLGIETE